MGLEVPEGPLVTAGYTRGLASSVSSYGNDARDNATQYIIGHNTEHTSQTHYGNNINVIPLIVTPDDAEVLRQARSRQAHDKLGVLEGILDTITQRQFGGRLSHRTEKQGDSQKALPVQDVSGRLSSHESLIPTSRRISTSHSEVYGNYMLEFLDPDLLGRYERTLDKIKAVSSIIFIINETESMEPYQNDRNIREMWKGITRERLSLQKIEAIFLDSRVNDAVREQLTEDSTGILQSTFFSAQTVQNLLLDAAHKSTPKKKRGTTGSGGGGVRRSPRRRKEIGASPSQTRSPIGKDTTPRTPPVSLASYVRELYNNLKKLSLEYDDIRRKTELAFTFWNAHDRYTTLYKLLCHRCPQHDAHIVDLELEATAWAHNISTNLKFRLTAPATDTEMLWSYSSTERLPAHDGVFPGEEMTCLLDIGQHPADSVERERLSRLLYVGEDAQLTCVHVGKQVHAVISLSTLNKVLHRCVKEPELLSLAKRIANAVLAFNCTPWFSTFWSCDNVVLYLETQGRVPLLQHLHVQDPHFRIRLENTAGDTSESSNSHFDGMLFCLGLALYELWKYFPGDEEVYEPDIDLESTNPERLTITRSGIADQIDKWLQKRTVSEAYAEVVNWCLNVQRCTVRDIKNPKRLHEIFEKVIGGLEEADREYRTFDFLVANRRT